MGWRRVKREERRGGKLKREDGLRVGERDGRRVKGERERGGRTE